MEEIIFDVKSTERVTPEERTWLKERFPTSMWFSIKCPVSIESKEMNATWKGKTCKIDGELYTIRGIESFAVTRQYEGIGLGLMVDPVGIEPTT